MKRPIVIGAFAGGALIVLAIAAVVRPVPSDERPAPPKDVAPPAGLDGGRVRAVQGGFVGCGWSVRPETRTAASEAIRGATRPGSDPSLTVVFYNTQHDPRVVATAIRSVKPKTRLIGATTHEGILSPDGYHVSPVGVVGVLAQRLDHVACGVGGAEIGAASPEDAARAALREAVDDAGDRAAGRRPSMILLFVTLPHEERVLEALAGETGPDVPLVGGTAAGSVDQLSRKKISNWSVVVNERVITSGVAVAVFYAGEPFAWSYGGGYRRTGTSGVVTKCRPRLILEIDGKPAAEVYDAWLGGRLAAARKRGENLVNFCSLYPVCRSDGRSNQFIRAWPSDEPEHPGSLRTGSSVREGDTVYLSEGNWNLLLNHFATVPGKARASMPDHHSAAGLFIYCGGALECIPHEARPQMALLVSRSLGDLPWLGGFTWGEQGLIPGMGNRHSNLSAGTILFPEPGGG